MGRRVSLPGVDRLRHLGSLILLVPGSFENLSHGSPTSSVPGVTRRALRKGAPQGVLRRCLPLPPTIAVSFSVAAPAPEVPVPAAGPEPWPVLRRVPAQREPDWERHRGSALPGEPPCLPHAASHLECVAGRAPPCPQSKSACMPACGLWASPGNCCHLSLCHTPPPPTPPGMAWPGLARIPPARPLSADPTARPRSGSEHFGSRYTCWPAVRRREPLRVSGAWLRPASLIRTPSNSQKEAPRPDPTCLQTFLGRDVHSAAPAGCVAAAHILIINKKR